MPLYHILQWIAKCWIRSPEFKSHIHQRMGAFTAHRNHWSKGCLVEAYSPASLQSSLFTIYYLAILFIGIGNNTLERRRWRKAARNSLCGFRSDGVRQRCSALDSKTMCIYSRPCVYIGVHWEWGVGLFLYGLLFLSCAYYKWIQRTGMVYPWGQIFPTIHRAAGYQSLFFSCYTSISLVSLLCLPQVSDFPFSLLRLIHPCLFYLFI